MRLIIVRHAEPDYSIDSLTKKGWREAEFLAERLSKLDVKACYCSPLGRAQDTSKSTLKKLGMTAETLDWLCEFRGTITDETLGGIHHAWDLKPDFWTKDDLHFDKDKWQNSDIMNSANTPKEYKIVCDGIDALLEKHGYRFNGKYYDVIKENRDTVILFCHFAVEMVILSRILNISPLQLWHGFVAVPSSVTTLITEEREEGKAYFRCNSFGDISHLYANDEPPSFMARFCENYSNEEERH